MLHRYRAIYPWDLDNAGWIDWVYNTQRQALMERIVQYHTINHDFPNHDPYKPKEYLEKMAYGVANCAYHYPTQGRNFSFNDWEVLISRIIVYLETEMSTFWAYFRKDYADKLGKPCDFRQSILNQRIRKRKELRW